MAIEIMSHSLSNQIAAGEVIERPASVVKELVENAIDAGATQIDLRIEEAGLRRIEVVDDGSGIEAHEVERAFERHATSKLHHKEDLFRIRSLGFRGEALPSIASVSKLSLFSSTGEQAGREVQLEGGQVVKSQATSVRQGTKVVVTDLFYNTPARLKYIKSPQTEKGHITDLIQRFSFAHPEIAFRFMSDGNLLIQTVGNGELRQAIAGVYGVNTAKKMLAISNEDFNYRLHGYISPPDLTRSNTSYINFVVNGRVIKNYRLNKALEKAYGSKLMINRHPIAIIHIDMDPLLVDVNVHPTKQQVRISGEEDLAQLITEAVKKALDALRRIPDALENISANQRSRQEEKSVHMMPQESYVQESLAADFSPRPIDASAEDSEVFFSEEHPQKTDQSKHLEDSVQVAQKRLEAEEKNPPMEKAAFPSLDYIGQMHGTYLFAQNEEGLYIIDQHAAQERIKYEYYRVEIGQEEDHQQQLLIPLLLEYPADEMMLIKENQSAFEDVGLYMEAFGDQTLILHSHPSWFEPDQVEETVKEMIDFFIDHEQINLAEFREATAIMMSCKRSIKANQYLNDQQAQQLLVDLAACENPYNCPHGRPVLVQLSNADMEKMFKRIQD